MPKRKIHFIGFLANVDDSITKLNLGKGFVIEKHAQQEVMPFLRIIDFHYGIDNRAKIIASGCYCVSKPEVTEFESTPQGGVVIQWGKGEELHSSIQDKLRLLRLFKEGNISLEFSCLYHLKDSQPSVVGLCREWPIADKTTFHLNDKEVLEAQSFIEDVTIPFKYQFLQLAFEAFELSYEVYDSALAFLSLMISMETMFNKKDRELQYSISRNAAVLLGSTCKESQDIFREVKSLYGKRSAIVHQGERNKVSKADVLKLRDYIRRSIKEINKIYNNKDSLLEMLNVCGFGQRPWKNQNGFPPPRE